MQELKPETVAHVILGARELNAGAEIFTGPEEEETVEQAQDLDETRLTGEKHDEHEHDPLYQELQSAIDTLSIDEQCELIALAWLGRGDGTADEWSDLVALARDRRSDHTGSYLLAMPLLAEHLADGLESFGFSAEDFEDESR